MADSNDVLALRSTSEVLCAEFKAIHPAQKLRSLTPAEDTEARDTAAKLGASVLPEAVVALAGYYNNVHALAGDGQTAICLSGGGIRSAAFGLGILQGLARRGLLSKTDYLSTVSGGGYIGSWLTAWAHRYASAPTATGMPNTFSALEKAVADRPIQAPIEAAPFRWLRANQKFLTPRSGIGSPDTWSAIASFMRDLILNWLVFFPLIGAAILAPRCVEYLLQYWEMTARSCGSSLTWMLDLSLQFLHLDADARFETVDCWQGWLDSFGAILVIVGMIVSTCNRRALSDTIGDKGFRRWVLLPVIFGAVALLMTISAWTFDGTDEPGRRLLQWMLLVPGGYMIARVAAIAWLFREPRWPRSHWTTQVWEVVGLIVNGALTGATIWCGLRLHAVFVGSATLAEDFAIMGVPWLLASFTLGQVAYAGFTSFVPIAQRDREWMARASGWYLAIAVLWLVCCGLVLEGPDLYQQAVSHISHWWVLGATAGTGGLTLATALSSATKATTAIAAVRERLSTSILLKMVAGVFLVGVIVLLAQASVELLLLLPPHVDVNLLRDQTDPGQADSVLTALAAVSLAMIILVTASWLVSLVVNVNLFSLHALYRDRLVRTFLGASNDQTVTGTARTLNRFDGFSPGDNLQMGEIWRDGQGNIRREGPFPVINMALNLLASHDLAQQDRKAESFVSTPLYTGGDRVGFRDSRLTASDMGLRSRGRLRAAIKENRVADIAKEMKTTTGLTLGTAMAVSGAAMSPNWGYHSSPVISFIMMLFNVRLGWWLGNPKLDGNHWLHSGPKGHNLSLLLQEAFGRTSDQEKYVYLSDGGHFENLGLYEMLRRRCRMIIVSDATADADCSLSDLGRSLRQAAIDFGITVTFASIDLQRRAPALDAYGVYCAIGTIQYPELSRIPDATPGTIIYIKPSLDRSIPADIRAFAAEDAKFPHDSTANQWFTESQFESYRALGSFIVRQLGGKASPDGADTSFSEFRRSVEDYLVEAGTKLVKPRPVRLVS